MKATIKYLGTLLTASLFFVSCEGFLDRFPQDKLSPETFLANETEMQTYTNSYYTMFPAAGDMYNEFSDVVIGTDLSTALWGGRTITSGESGWSWTNLRKLNTFIEYAGNCKDEAVRNEYVALTRFFRAYFYFEKVKMFGDVPWYENTIGSEDEVELKKPRDSREYVMQKMIEDIDFAIENLPDTHSDYRVTKWTALAFKSRFCLFEGTFRKYHAGEETLKTLPADAQPYTYYLEQAAAAADEFMKSSGYSLYTADTPETNYLNLFNKHKVSDGPNQEFILARNYDIQYGVVHSANASYQSATLGRPGLTRKLVASYLMKDGTSFTEKYKGQWETMQFVDETKDRDPRLAQSIRTPGYCRLGTTTPVAPQLSNTVTGYAPIKYLTGVEDDTYQTAYVDMPIFRTAEVYLNYAEAKAELGTITQPDIDRSIKLIRARVGMPNLDVNVAADPYLLDKHSGYPKVAVKNSSNVGVILEIRRERTIELLQEGFRYYDIMRWAEGSTFETPLYGMYFPGEGTYDLNADGTYDLTLYIDKKPADAAALAYNLGVDNGDGLREGAEITLSEGDKGHVEFHKNTRPGWKWDTVKDYYYPIPVGDRNLTGGALTQNPGWNDGLSF
jgi:hypothetical protein